MNIRRKKLEFLIRVNQYRGSYEWGHGNTQYFLNVLKLNMIGKIIEGPTAFEYAGRLTNIEVEASSHIKDPISYDAAIRKENEPIGEVELSENCLKVYLSIPRFGVQSLLQLISCKEESTVGILCSPKEEIENGIQRYDLLSISLDTE